VSREALRSAALVLGPLLLLAAIFGACFERRTEEVPVGYSREALTNPYLALERLLARMGREVFSLDGLGDLDALPPTDAWLLVPTSRDTLSAERSRALLDWVEAGGHLLVVTWSLWEDEHRRPDPLLDRFGLQQHRGVRSPGEGEPDGEAAEEDAQPAPPPAGADALGALLGALGGAPREWDEALLAWPGRPEPLRLQFDPRFRWVDAQGRATRIAAGPAGMHLLVLEHGRGLLSALTDDWLLRNDHLGELDHAELLTRLADLGGRPGPVWIVTSTRWPGLWSQAVRYATPVLASLAALLAAWLWRASRRFGPLRPLPPPQRRRWFEHLEAAGHYHWREGHGRALVESTRECVLRELARRRPELARLDPVQRDPRVALLAALRSDQVAHALDGLPRRPEEFTATIAHLERIRASL
jgi:hypothetical protein